MTLPQPNQAAAARLAFELEQVPISEACRVMREVMVELYKWLLLHGWSHTEALQFTEEFTHEVVDRFGRPGSERLQ
jgi:hypothetical protein